MDVMSKIQVSSRYRSPISAPTPAHIGEIDGRSGFVVPYEDLANPCLVLTLALAEEDNIDMGEMR